MCISELLSEMHIVFYDFTPFTPLYTDVGQALNVGFSLIYKGLLCYYPFTLYFQEKEKQGIYIPAFSSSYWHGSLSSKNTVANNG